MSKDLQGHREYCTRLIALARIGELDCPACGSDVIAHFDDERIDTLIIECSGGDVVWDPYDGSIIDSEPCWLRMEIEPGAEYDEPTRVTTHDRWIGKSRS